MRVLRRPVLLMLGLLICVLSLIPVTAQSGGTLIVTSLSDVNSLDPALGYDTVSWPTISLVYRGLVTYSDDMTEIVPALAESFTASDDGTVYSFTLRDGIKFSNGREITPEDVKYTFERLLNPETASPGAYMFEMIDGVEAFTNGEVDDVSGIVIVDDHTVEFDLSVPEWTFLNRLALPFGSIVAREGVEEAGEDFARQPLGAGPFVLDSWEPGLRLTFSRNPNFYREGYPLVDGVEINIGVEPSVAVLQIESGQADAMLDVVPTGEYARISQDPNLADNMMLSRAFANLIYVAPDTRSEPFNNLDVRRALDMAVDRDHLVEILNGRATPGVGPIPPGVQGDNADLQPQAFDLEGAQALLEQAGYADGIDTQLYTYTDPTLTAVGQALVQDWSQIGVNAELVTLDFAALLDLMYNNPQEMPLLLIDWYMDYPDPSNTYQPLIRCGASNNPGAYCNEDLDAMEAAAAALPPGEDRWNAYAELEAAVAEQLPILTLYHVNQYYYFSDRVTGMNSHPAYIINFESLSLQ